MGVGVVVPRAAPLATVAVAVAVEDVHAVQAQPSSVAYSHELMWGKTVSVEHG
jgi:hypothetical protein